MTNSCDLEIIIFQVAFVCLFVCSPDLNCKQFQCTEGQILLKLPWRRLGKRNWPQHNSSDPEPSQKSPHRSPPPGSKLCGSARAEQSGLIS